MREKDAAVESRLLGYGMRSALTDIRRFPGSLGCFFFFFPTVATTDREFVHGRVHLSARDLQFNTTASSRNASALSDGGGHRSRTTQKKRLPLPQYFLLLTSSSVSRSSFRSSSRILFIPPIRKKVFIITLTISDVARNSSMMIDKISETYFPLSCYTIFKNAY